MYARRFQQHAKYWEEDLWQQSNKDPWSKFATDDESVSTAATSKGKFSTAATLIEAAARGGASRQALAALGSALFRLSTADASPKSHDCEPTFRAPASAHPRPDALEFLLEEVGHSNTGGDDENNLFPNNSSFSAFVISPLILLILPIPLITTGPGEHPAEEHPAG